MLWPRHRCPSPSLLLPSPHSSAQCPHPDAPRPQVTSQDSLFPQTSPQDSGGGGQARPQQRHLKAWLCHCGAQSGERGSKGSWVTRPRTAGSGRCLLTHVQGSVSYLRALILKQGRREVTLGLTTPRVSSLCQKEEQLKVPFKSKFPLNSTSQHKIRLLPQEASE